MKSTKIEPRQNGVNPKKLNTQELLFVHTLAADINFDAIQAVRECYPKCKNASSQVSKLLARPHIQKMLGVVLRKRLERLELKADDILGMLRDVLAINPFDWFKVTPDGRWLVENPDELPNWVGRIVERVKPRMFETKDGSLIPMYEVELMSKIVALGLAMKHIGVDGEKPATLVQINWDGLSQGQVIDVVEQRLIEEDKK